MTVFLHKQYHVEVLCNRLKFPILKTQQIIGSKTAVLHGIDLNKSCIKLHIDFWQIIIHSSVFPVISSTAVLP